eukprot:30096-Pelagococcus_subviridis.AAC.3
MGGETRRRRGEGCERFETRSIDSSVVCRLRPSARAPRVPRLDRGGPARGVGDEEIVPPRGDDLARVPERVGERRGADGDLRSPRARHRISRGRK